MVEKWEGAYEPQVCIVLLFSICEVLRNNIALSCWPLCVYIDIRFLFEG